MTPTQIKTVNPRINIIKWSANDGSITTGIEDCGNGFFIVRFSTATGRLLQTQGNGKKAFKKIPKLV